MRARSIAIVLALAFVSAWLETCVPVSAAPARTGSRSQSPVRRPVGNLASGANNAAYNSYVQALRNKVQSTWVVPDGKNHVVITATVQSDGSVSDVQMSSTPKNDSAEAAGFDAFNKAQPLSVLPANLQSAKLTATFESSADPHGDSNSNLFMRLDPIAAPKAQSQTTVPAANTGNAPTNQQGSSTPSQP